MKGDPLPARRVLLHELRRVLGVPDPLEEPIAPEACRIKPPKVLFAEADPAKVRLPNPRLERSDRLRAPRPSVAAGVFPRSQE